jgi:hypothetical protein
VREKISYLSEQGAVTPLLSQELSCCRYSCFNPPNYIKEEYSAIMGCLKVIDDCLPDSRVTNDSVKAHGTITPDPYSDLTQELRTVLKAIRDTVASDMVGRARLKQSRNHCTEDDEHELRGTHRAYPANRIAGASTVVTAGVLRHAKPRHSNPFLLSDREEFVTLKRDSEDFSHSPSVDWKFPMRARLTWNDGLFVNDFGAVDLGQKIPTPTLMNYVVTEKWRGVVSECSGMNLSRQNDRLPDMARVTRSVGNILGDRCLAAFWQSGLPVDLLLRRVNHSLELERQRLSYRTPSWSWASVNERVAYFTRSSGDAVSLHDVTRDPGSTVSSSVSQPSHSHQPIWEIVRGSLEVTAIVIPLYIKLGSSEDVFRSRRGLKINGMHHCAETVDFISRSSHTMLSLRTSSAQCDRQRRVLSYCPNSRRQLFSFNPFRHLESDVYPDYRTCPFQSPSQTFTTRKKSRITVTFKYSPRCSTTWTASSPHPTHPAQTIVSTFTIAYPRIALTPQCRHRLAL